MFKLQNLIVTYTVLFFMLVGMLFTYCYITYAAFSWNVLFGVYFGMMLFDFLVKSLLEFKVKK